jgi:hypothetical protein
MLRPSTEIERMAEPAPAPEGEALPDWDAAADETIAACDGDVRLRYGRYWCL